MKYLHLILAVAFNVSAYVIFKGISTRPNDIIWTALFSVGLGLGAVNVFFFTKALRDINLAVAYPTFAGASIALIVLVSSLLFRERIDMTNIIGSIVVVFGIYLLTK
jgi:multidrug transporter EmrE-like cation transporter